MFIWKKSLVQELHFNLQNGEAINQSFKRKGKKEVVKESELIELSLIVPCHFTAMT